MIKQTIYLDYAAATPLDKRVFKAMQPYFSEQFYNPSAPYRQAREVRRAIEEARAKSAAFFGAKPAEIIFTAGATESIHLAFSGLLKHGGHCVTTNSEHVAALEAASSYKHTLVKVGPGGRLAIDDLIHAVRDDTVLVSVGMVNNETGVMQDIKHIAGALKAIRRQRLEKKIKTPLYFHTDATQAAGCFDLSVARLGVDLLTLGGNKIYAPKQTGLLFKASHVSLEPIFKGGGQEQNLRSGTENVAGIIGLGEALAITTTLRSVEYARLHTLKSIFVNQLVDLIPGTLVLGDQKHSSPHIVMLAWPGLDGERLLYRLENEGLLVNTGAACAAKKEAPSHVLQAMSISNATITGSLRFSFGRETNQKELLSAVKMVAKAIKQERL